MLAEGRGAEVELIFSNPKGLRGVRPSELVSKYVGMRRSRQNVTGELVELGVCFCRVKPKSCS